MKIPTDIRITKKVTYSVVYKDDMGEDYRGHKIYGECIPDERKIILTLDQSETEKTKTFIHEIIHCIEAEYSLQIPHAMVDILEEAVYKILKLNHLIK